MAKPQEAATATATSPFADFAGLCAFLPMYKPRTLRSLLKKKILPVVRPPGTRKLGFHLPAVEAALLRQQKGGIQ